MNIMRRVGIHAYGDSTLGQQNYARKFGVSLYQVFLGSPQRYWARKEELEDIEIFKGCVRGLNEQVICHAPYLINLADDVNSRNWKMSLKSILSISQACADRGINKIVVHAGSDKGRGVNEADKSWFEALKVLVSKFPHIVYCIENSAYKSNLYSDIDTLRDLVLRALGTQICLDIAHYWSAGHGFSKEEYEKLLSMRNFIGVIHLNNHPKVCGANIDRHTSTALSDGMIPLDVYRSILRDFQCPMIMELDDDPSIVESSYRTVRTLSEEAPSVV